jgi:hypothetical protein
MRTYRIIIISQGYGDKVTSLQRGGSIQWHDEDGEFEARDLASITSKVEATYSDTLDYFRDKGYKSHDTVYGRTWKMMTKSTGDTH